MSYLKNIQELLEREKSIQEGLRLLNQADILLDSLIQIQNEEKYVIHCSYLLKELVHTALVKIEGP